MQDLLLYPLLINPILNHYKKEFNPKMFTFSHFMLKSNSYTLNNCYFLCFIKNNRLLEVANEFGILGRNVDNKIAL